MLTSTIGERPGSIHSDGQAVKVLEDSCPERDLGWQLSIDEYHKTDSRIESMSGGRRSLNSKAFYAIEDRAPRGSQKGEQPLRTSWLTICLQVKRVQF